MGARWLLPLLVPVLIAACGDDSVESPENRFSARDTFAVDVTKSSRSELDLTGINGTIAVKGVAGATAISVRAIARVESDSQADADARISQITVDVDSTGDAVLVETQQPSNTGGRNYVVDYTVTVPRSFNVFVTGVNGSVPIEGIDGFVTVDFTNGSVALNGIVGGTAVNLVSGRIDGRVTIPPSGELDVDVASGFVKLGIPISTSAQFEAVTGTGTVTVVGLNLQGGVVESNRVTGTLGGGDGTVSVTAAVGDITVEGF
jgi:hypothetical protein